MVYGEGLGLDRGAGDDAQPAGGLACLCDRPPVKPLDSLTLPGEDSRLAAAHTCGHTGLLEESSVAGKSPLGQDSWKPAGPRSPWTLAQEPGHQLISTVSLCNEV